MIKFFMTPPTRQKGSLFFPEIFPAPMTNFCKGLPPLESGTIFDSEISISFLDQCLKPEFRR
jgi:hypothetical protein